MVRLRPDAAQLGRDRFVKELYNRNIGTSVHFIPIHLHSYYRNKYNYESHDFPVAFSHFQRLLSLPLTPFMTDQDVADVIEAVLDVLASNQQQIRLAA